MSDRRPGRARQVGRMLTLAAACAGVALLGRRASAGLGAPRGASRSGPPSAGEPPLPPPVSVTGRARRNVAVAGLSARVGRAAARNRAQRVFASAQRRAELDAALQLRTATEVAETLGQMKGALMKIGQMASYLDEGLPEPLREALSRLQADAPPMAAELASEVVEAQLGSVPERLFHEWDPVPIAAASIGQVHRAITRDGRAVAVKVQYPGVADAIAADLGNAGLVFGALARVFPGFDPAPVTAELRTRLTEELDYRIEAANQELFAGFFAGHPFISVPGVHRDLSGARVLTTDLVVGAPFAEVVDWPAEERDLAGETLFRFVFRSLYRLHAFNADPHPGNYLFGGGGRVTFLDFGLVRRFDAGEVARFEAMVTNMVLHQDPAGFRRAAEDAGLLARDAPLDDEDVYEFFGHFYSFIRRPGRFEWTPERASVAVRKTFDTASPVTRYTTVPASFVLIQRINLGLYAVLGRLRAGADWRRVAEELWPWVEGPPSTPLGEAEAAWSASR